MPKLPFALLFAAIATAQSFEVASIKFHAPPITLSVDPAIRGNRVRGTASTLLDMITTAYDMRYDQVTGAPAWASSEHYDLEAKAEGEGTITKEQFHQMVQALLADRFQLKVHRENREVPAYALVVGKNGPKFQPSAPDATGSSFVRGGAVMHMEASRATMEQLARQLSGSAGRPVVDKTGLTGYYKYTFDWTPANRPSDPDSDNPSMFTALQEQLGLRLEPAKALREILVIDSAVKPSQN